MVDEKRQWFEEKCCGLDRHAMFHYKGCWQVRHSKCSKWVTIQEPYNLVRFREHIQGCKHAGAKTRDGTISQFFKPRDPKETGTRMAQHSARKQIFVGATAKLEETFIKPNLPSIPFATNKRPCLGLGKDHDERINTYISHVIVEGADSRSETQVAKTLFGEHVKYSELDIASKRCVAAAQLHMQRWKISHSLGVVFSADCRGEVSDETRGFICDRCSDLLKLDAFRKTLGTKPPPLDKLKYTPNRHRNAATNLGIHLAKIEGVSDLFEKVSFDNFNG